MEIIKDKIKTFFFFRNNIHNSIKVISFIVTVGYEISRLQNETKLKPVGILKSPNEIMN